MNEKHLFFYLKTDFGHVWGNAHKFTDHINASPWRGKEPKTCKVDGYGTVDSVPVGPGTTAIGEFIFRITYRAPGTVNIAGGNMGAWWAGWKLKYLNRRPGGAMLDEFGGPLQPGRDPIELEADIYHEADFNDFDFGEDMEAETGRQLWERIVSRGAAGRR